MAKWPFFYQIGKNSGTQDGSVRHCGSFGYNQWQTMMYEHGYFTDRVLNYLLEYHRDLVQAPDLASFLKTQSQAAIDRYLAYDKAGLSDSEATELALSETLSLIRSPLSALRELAADHFGQLRAEQIFPEARLLSFLETYPLTLAELDDAETQAAVFQAMQQALVDQK